MCAFNKVDALFSRHYSYIFIYIILLPVVSIVHLFFDTNNHFVSHYKGCFCEFFSIFYYHSCLDCQDHISSPVQMRFPGVFYHFRR